MEIITIRPSQFHANVLDPNVYPYIHPRLCLRRYPYVYPYLESRMTTIDDQVCARGKTASLAQQEDGRTPEFVRGGKTVEHRSS